MSKTDNEKLGWAVFSPVIRPFLGRVIVDEFWPDGKQIMSFGRPALRVSVCSNSENNNARIVDEHIENVQLAVKNLYIGATTPQFHVTYSSTHKHKITFYVPIDNLHRHVRKYEPKRT